MFNTLRVQKKLHEFNELLGEPYAQLNIRTPAQENEINAVLKHFEMTAPADLIQFYREFGGITSYNGEYLSIDIDTPERILRSLQAENQWFKLRSLGLIDYIKFTWGNDRPEFDFVPQEEIDFINKNYRCIGMYRYTWGLEEAHYLYFDCQGKFGEVRYHQDSFDALWSEHLDNMLEKSQATESLEEIIVRIVEKLKGGMQT